jgi:hypothetical protein
MPFVKLDCSILYSSIWAESSETRIIWITMLAMADQTGLVHATAPGISAASFIPLESTRKAISILETPDPDSKSTENEGRRIMRVDGGYSILNYEKYRAFNYSLKKDAVRKREYRTRIKETIGDKKEDIVPKCPGHSASVSVSVSESKKDIKTEELHKTNEIEILSDYIMKHLKIPMSDKSETKKLIKSFGLQYMIDAVDRMEIYFAAVKENKWKVYVIGKHWRNLYEKLEYFSSNENLKAKLEHMATVNTAKPQEEDWIMK